MTLRPLPELQAFRLPSVCAFEPDPEALERFNGGVRASQTSDNTISILDVIGEDYWTGAGVGMKRVAAALRAIGERDVIVDINSPGGDFFEGIAIYNALRAHKHKVTVRILGIAASAASVIAMAGDEILIGKAGFLMVHNAWSVTIGNRHDLAEAVAKLEPFDDAMAALYAERAGVEKATAAQWMDNETFFNGEQAVAEGLADSFLPADAAEEDATKASASRSINATRRLDALLAKAGLPRSERRSLIGDVKGGTQDAAASVTRDADEIRSLLEGLRSTIRS